MVVFTLNAHSPPALAFSTLAIVSYLLSEQIANTILYDPLAGTYLYGSKPTSLMPHEKLHG